MNKISNFFIASETNNYSPPALSYKAFLIYGLLMILLRLFLGTLPAHSAAVESQTLMDMINSERSSRNLTVLAQNSSLRTAAGQKSQDMIDRDYFAHVDPDGNYVWPKIIAAGYGQYKILGENLAVDFVTSEGMIKAWLDSPTHRANLLHSDFLEQGLIALYGDFQGRYTNLTTSLFGARASGVQTPPAPPPPAPSPNPIPTPKPAPSAPKPAPPPAAKPTLPQPTPAVTPTPVEKQDSTSTPLATADLSALSGSFTLPEIALNTKAINISRVLFSILGFIILSVLAVDSVIILQHEAVVIRSHSSSHLFNLMLIVLVSILIWCW